ncbi:15678_t:CDS:2, partial [Racocetra fulgida]
FDKNTPVTNIPIIVIEEGSQETESSDLLKIFNVDKSDSHWNLRTDSTNGLNTKEESKPLSTKSRDDVTIAIMKLILRIIQIHRTTPFSDKIRAFGKKMFYQRVLILLTIAAVTSLGLDLYEDFSENALVKLRWIEGTLISIHDVLIGDIIQIELDVIPADGILISSYNIHCDQSDELGGPKNGKINFMGSKPETALLQFLLDLGVNYKHLKEDAKTIQFYPFSSERKTMGLRILAIAYRDLEQWSLDEVTLDPEGATGGIYTGGIVIEDPEFRNLSPEKLKEILPQLQVLARSNKCRIVTLPREALLKREVPEFTYQHPFNKERSVCTAIDVNINSVFNTVMGAEYDFSDRSPYVGNPDFTCYSDKELLLLEAKMPPRKSP